MSNRRLFAVATACASILSILIISHNPMKELEKEEGHAFDAFEYWYTQRSAPYELIPQGAFMRAMEYVRTSMTKESDLDAVDTTQWISIGPDNVGGRVLAITLDPITPNTVWTGAASGGLWKSTTAGVGSNAWTYVNTGYPTVAVSSIAINPLNTAVMYIGTGEVGSAYGRGQVGTPGARSSYGIGILKSTDGGTTWGTTGLIYTFPQVASVQEVIINPLNPGTLFAATTEGVFKSTDAGTTWSLSNSELMAMDLVINPSDTTVLYSSHGQRNSTADPGIYKTTNAGVSWTKLAGGLPTSNFGRTTLALALSSPSTVYASIANASSSALLGLYRTTNAGTTWTLMNSSTNYLGGQGWYDNVVGVDPTNPDIVFCGGLDLYRSTNGGTTLTQRTFWYLGNTGVVPAGGPEGPTNYVHADQHSVTFHPTNPSIIFFGCDGGIFVSTDGGNTFGGRNGGFVTTQFYNGLATSETNPSIALGGLQDNGTVKFLGGLSWDKTYGGDGGWCAIDPTNDDIMYEEYVYLAISKTTNGGANWFSSTSGLATGSSNANFIAPFVVAPSDGNILYAGAKVVYKTTNGGANWFATNGGANFNGTQVSCIGVSHLSPDTLLAATGSSATSPTFQVFRSINGGTSWTNVTGSLPNRYPTDIAFDPRTSLVAYISYSGFGSSHVFRSSNAGLTWTDITTNLPDIPAQSVTVDPLLAGYVYVGTDLGVYRTTNSGASWHLFDNGMPPAMVLDLTISNPGRALFAATFGNGVYKRGLPLPELFDNRALAFVNPSSGGEILSGTEITPISATFATVGTIASLDSFDVTFRILRNGSEEFMNTLRQPPMSQPETRTIVFDGSFTPADTGTYAIQAIMVAGDQNATNDTLKGTIKVVLPGTIASIMSIKSPCTYMEISGAAGPTGDDVQMVIPLPFAFTFDGYAYDSLQISTNGWAELGTGARGSERGISTSGQVGLGNENGRLFTTARPTKALGVWWEDLNTTGGGTVTYTTLGTSPDRVFVVQWKEMLAYYDPGTTTTRINFQLRLNENNNTIEYHYGPVTAGTLAGSDLGAMMGVKDHVGGNYHYYDLALGGTGTVGQGITTLSPLTDWPGPDSCFTIGNDLAGPVVALASAWNLISVPVVRTDNSVASVYPTSISGSTFSFSGSSYQSASTLSRGVGYWSKFPASTSQQIIGTSLQSIGAPVVEGWNLIGSVDHEVPAPSGGIVASLVYSYSTFGYEPVSSIIPGKGYWVKASSTGELPLGPIPPVAAPTLDLNSLVIITITDQLHRKQSLYLTGSRSAPANPDLYEMPPGAPEGSFDARFTSQRILEVYPSDLTNSVTFDVEVTGRPRTISASLPSGGGTRFFVETGITGGVVSSHELLKGNPISLDGVSSLRILVVNGIELPLKFALDQNYPNPFNPSTTIRYALPYDSKVSIGIFDITGREVSILENVSRPAGRHSVEWNALGANGTTVGSGVYFCRIKAVPLDGTSGFVSTRKMILLR